MQKLYKIIAYNGMEIIDPTPEAENRLAAMEYAEERRNREIKRKRKLARNPLRRLAYAYCNNI